MLFFVGLRHPFRVEGDSMLPTLKNGDNVLVDTNAAVGPGDIVVAHHPYKASVKMIKRVTAVEQGRFVLHGDCLAESSDSRSFGSISRHEIAGKVVCRVSS